MEPHRLAEPRSLAYHRLVADRLGAEPAILARARARVAEWLRQTPPPYYALQWAERLAGTLPALRRFLVDPGAHATELRQSTPFAGAIDARERWLLWREVAERMQDRR
ncbi:hypothetical protein K2Z84_14175 [Candidatus Binatia bacterium]|jgi:hypothetical protein|nr:hypothetical protein [Candidatus Binatia bacterium]